MKKLIVAFCNFAKVPKTCLKMINQEIQWQKQKQWGPIISGIRYFTTDEIREYLMKIKNNCLRCDIIVTEMWKTFIKNKKDMKH
jgi:hypothetical protein